MHMHPPTLGAAVQFQKHLARVQKSLRIEGAFELLLAGEVGLGELGRASPRHPMLPGQHAADIDAKVEDVGAELRRD